MIDFAFQLDQIVAAQARIERSNHISKIVLTL